MVNKDLERVINQVVRDAEMEAGFLKHARDADFVIRQRLLNAGNTFQRLAMEMFFAAGGTDDEGGK